MAAASGGREERETTDRSARGGAGGWGRERGTTDRSAEKKTVAPAVAARRAVRCAARAARARGQSGSAARSGSAGAVTVWPRRASLAALAGPARAILTARPARASWVTVTVR